MKSRLSTLMIVTGILLISLKSQAQEENGCFMLDANGQPINLEHLCPDSSENLSNPNPDSFQIPIKRREAGIPVIDVVFNEQHSFEMLVDTGASATVLTPQMADTLKVKPEGTVPIATAGGVIQAPVGRVGSIQAGGAVVKNLVITIAPTLPIGLLGQDFFGNYDMSIQEKTIEFRVRK